MTIALALATTPITAQVYRSEPDEDLTPRRYDRRSHEVLRLDCRTEVGRRDLTLFANGTSRLRQESKDELEPFIRLLELKTELLDTYIGRVAAEDLSETWAEQPDIRGEWIDLCQLTVHVDWDEDPLIYRFSRFDSLSLAMSRVVRVADELAALTETEAPTRRLSSSYVPKWGDVLLRVDGVLFEVEGFSMDGKGVELSGVEEPWVVYIPVSELGTEFIAVVEHGDKDGWE